MNRTLSGRDCLTGSFTGSTHFLSPSPNSGSTGGAQSLPPHGLPGRSKFFPETLVKAASPAMICEYTATHTQSSTQFQGLQSSLEPYPDTPGEVMDAL